MDWSDERYVRLYTRDTATWKLIRWEGQLVLMQILRKVDRAGVLDFGEEGPAAAISAITEVPLEIVEIGLQRLLSRGSVVVKDDALVLPKFLDAQEAKQSDKHRMKEYRARRRDQARHGDVTNRNGIDTGRNEGEDAPDLPEDDAVVTNRNGGVTPRNGGVTPRSQIVTPSLAMPSRTVPSASQNKNQTRAGARAGAGSGSDEDSNTDPLPSPPRRRGDILNAPVSAEDYEPLADHELYATARGLTLAEYDATLVDLRQKGWGPAPPARWDARLNSFIDAAVQSKTRVRATQPKLKVVAPPAPYVPSTSNNFDGPIARMLFADDDDEDEGREA